MLELKSNRMQITNVVVPVVCLLMFLYKAGECVHKFCQHDTITKVDEVLSLHHPLPKICLQFGIDQKEMKSFARGKKVFLYQKKCVLGVKTVSPPVWGLGSIRKGLSFSHIRSLTLKI